MSNLIKPYSFEFSCLGKDYKIEFYRYHYKVLVKELNIWTGGLVLAVSGLTDDPRSYTPVNVEPSNQYQTSLILFHAAKAIKAAKKNKKSTKARSVAFSNFLADLSNSKNWNTIIQLEKAIGVA